MDVLELDLSSLNEQNSPELNEGSVVELDAKVVSYQQFFANYLLPNRPCLLKNVSSEWACQRDWIKNEKPDFDYLFTRFGEADVPVSNCNERYFNAQSKSTMKLSNYLQYWQDYIQNDYNEQYDCLYMKDWHFANENPLDNAYRVPSFFASDWINEYLLANPELNDDYRFVYMGPKGTWTPLHSDVFSSFSWSVNICGSKKWIFLPPGVEERVKNKFGVLAYDLKSVELHDASEFPYFSSSSTDFIELTQNVGDAIFVPSNWHHQVWNLDDTISFNHNWINGCNVDKMWTAMNDCFTSVRKEIADCRDMDNWDDQCELLLKSTFGVNHDEFYRFISFIASSRIDQLRKKELLIVTGNWNFGTNHMIFDLEKIERLLIVMLKEDIPCYKAIENDIAIMLSNIKTVVAC